MPFRLLQNESIEFGLRRIASEQIEKALHELSDHSLQPDDTVHQVRKRCKKVRAVLRLARAPLGKIYRNENSRFREIANELAAVRDAEVMVVTFDKVANRFDDQFEPARFAPIRRALVRRRDSIVQGARVVERDFKGVQRRLQKARNTVESWNINGEGFDPLDPGLRRTYRRGHRAMKAAYTHPDPVRFHEWRKRVKYLRYQLRLLRDLWPPVMKGLWGEAVVLSNLLGDAHDLTVLQQTLLSLETKAGVKEPLPAFLGLLAQHRTELHRQAHTLGRRIYLEKPKHLLRRFHGYWNIWRPETPAT